MSTHRASSDTTRIPAAADLDRWIEHDWADGVQLDRLPPLESLVVQTANSTYELTVMSPLDGTIMVRGGRFFPVPTRVQLAGACLGGSFLKLRGIYVGFSMEVWLDREAVITSPVRSIRAAAHQSVQ